MALIERELDNELLSTRRSTDVIAMFESPTPSVGPMKMCGFLFSVGSARSSSAARLLNGTVCTLPAFMCPAGTVHSPAARSISSHLAPITSPVRAAVRMVNSRARAAMPSRWRSSTIKAGSSAYRQHMFEVPRPTRWIVTAAILAHGGPIQDGLNAPTHARHGFGLGLPVRLNALQHQPGIDIGHRQIADVGKDIALERRGPLRAMLGVLPGIAISGDVSLSAVTERYGLGRFQRACSTLRFPVIDWIDAVVQ
jgi:hypothetical protein